ncbi:hypothetical protein H310_01220 [Aphanomyces invadans]|uniref:Uncharacterized protein n=1 Tax=Aphanomyces invadans TaxID=157072 RepID=A0A024USN6_9STRA|nr:hypothetical protein H310_01220 [Aphanomyces invadans]ETW08693.1 hypothetical protein H310_01220 [Aphanomyces invadans]|eukprot:XP_008862498.1 hypothetical protein H310_01220 [Aphanomyces invadans]
MRQQPFSALVRNVLPISDSFHIFLSEKAPGLISTLMNDPLLSTIAFTFNDGSP